MYADGIAQVLLSLSVFLLPLLFSFLVKGRKKRLVLFFGPVFMFLVWQLFIENFVSHSAGGGYTEVFLLLTMFYIAIFYYSILVLVSVVIFLKRKFL